jgi:hypothetical protein
VIGKKFNKNRMGGGTYFVAAERDKNFVPKRVNSDLRFFHSLPESEMNITASLGCEKLLC